MKMNLEKWNDCRKDVERKIKAHKHLLRGELANTATYEDHLALYDLKAQATRLYVIRAGSRGKPHILSGPVCEDMQEFDLSIPPLD